MSGQSTARERERALAALARRQHGLVARRQLLALGWSAHQIEHRLASGSWIEVHRGVYALGPAPLTREGRWMAATLVAPGAVLSHRAAAAHWGIRRGAMLEITAPKRLRRPGITVHQATLQADEATVHEGIPVTTVARTLFDLAAVIPQNELEWAIHEADFRKLWDRPLLQDLVAVIATREGPIAVDALWRDEGLAIEMDASGTHNTRRAFLEDRRRDRALRPLGIYVMRLTDRDLLEQGDVVERDIRRELQRGRSPVREMRA